MRHALMFLLVSALVACGKGTTPAADTSVVETVTAARQRLVVEVEATGVIRPIEAVEVRSKASGQIVALPVETGAIVRRGDLLVRIDPRDPQNRFEQAQASLRAAEAAVQVAKTQYDRNQSLLAKGVLTAPEVESARLTQANAQAQLVSARANLELATIALEDVTIRAPSDGIVIARNVSPGQVIASATNSPSGGTILMSLADLTAVYDSVLVNESDIGRIKPGQSVAVTADAYPGRTFRGTVTKVEPNATVQQSVTFFPVKIRLENTDGALMPGMNTDVSVMVAQEDNVLVVPVDAVRTAREAPTVATALGLDPEAVRALAAGNGRRATAQGDTTSGTPVAVARGDSAGTGRADGRAGNRRTRRGGGTGGGTGGAAGSSPRGATAERGGRGIAFVKTATGLEPRVVTTGLRNYDVVEITGGLKDGEQVALVSGALLQQSRQRQQDQIRSRTSMPGMGGSGAGGGGQGGQSGRRGGG
ncbi:MAG: efflux RND transporter periplasmic adaptor subunit [Gemmatimonadaceae bacterium]|jgi:HlyD family secretion protein|nr:efflux RND transporter periplasmic adaptor subunit [Gemmatimonadaceae bacterium]